MIEEEWERRLNYSSTAIQLTPRLNCFTAVSASRRKINPATIDYSLIESLPGRDRRGLPIVLNFRLMTVLIQPKLIKDPQPAIDFKTTFN